MKKLSILLFLLLLSACSSNYDTCDNVYYDEKPSSISKLEDGLNFFGCRDVKTDFYELNLSEKQLESLNELEILKVNTESIKVSTNDPVLFVGITRPNQKAESIFYNYNNDSIVLNLNLQDENDDYINIQIGKERFTLNYKDESVIGDEVFKILPKKMLNTLKEGQLATSYSNNQILVENYDLEYLTDDAIDKVKEDIKSITKELDLILKKSGIKNNFDQINRDFQAIK